MAESVVIVGGGIAGMCSALALSRAGFEVTILERDDAPPEGDADKAFFDWARRGASQFRHPHAFLGLMCNLLQDHYPDLMQDFYDAGARRAEFAEMLPPKLASRYQPEDEDQRLWMLLCRRATIETVLRRYLLRQPGIRFVDKAIIDGVITERDDQGLVVKGISLFKGDDLFADVVIDASGRTTKFPKWFGDVGTEIAREDESADILYYTRHYKLKPGVEEPPRNVKDRAAGDLGYIKFGVFPGDKGNFALIICLHQAEAELLEAVKDGDQFDAICRSIPGLQPWVAEDKAEATTHPFGMADIRAVWLHYVQDGQPLVRNFFAVGDAAVRTNPLYGRGCSTGILHAHMLADVLTRESDATARAQAFDKLTEDQIRPIYKASLAEDRNGKRRALAAAEGRKVEEAKGIKAWLMGLIADSTMAASQSDIHVFRGMMRTMNLLEQPGAFMKEGRVQWAIFRQMFKGRKKNATARIVRGPRRSEMLERIRLGSAGQSPARQV